MGKIRRALLTGGRWGVVVGAAVALAGVVGPGLRPVAGRAMERYLEAARRAATAAERNRSESGGGAHAGS